MVQRPLRLGDVVDDYCPRERRVTNHAIVAIIGETVRQTRCSTCDAEHEYKGARMLKSPKKKLKPGSTETAESSNGVLVTSPANDTDAAGVEPAAVVAAVETVDVSVAPPNGDAEPARGADDPPGAWFTHRPLIRASLPKTEGAEPPPRPIPEFTMHQRPPARGFHRGFRPGGSGGGPSNNNHGGGFREGNGPDGNRPSQPGKPGAGGRRRRRRRR